MSVSNVAIWRLLALLTISTVAAFYLRADIHAVMQRDGAHFVFMANNIAHGEPPYWASFETKNPLVEIYWSPFIRLFSGAFGIVESARIAEAFWMAATALLIFFVVSVPSRGAPSRQRDVLPIASAVLPAIVVSLLYVVLALDVRVTDNGLNIALYQSLPELALLALLLRVPGRRWFAHGFLIGVFVFLGWFVKQTSLLPDALIVVSWLMIMRNRLGYSWLIGGCLGASICLGGFALHLILTDTLQNYLLGTVRFRAGLSPVLMDQFVANAKTSYLVPLWSLDLVQFLSVHRVWTAIAMVILTPLAAVRLYNTRSEGWTKRRLALVLAIAWMIGAWLQAVVALTFFAHYFLASLAPVAVVMGLLLSMSSRRVVFTSSGIVLVLVAGLIYSYVGMKQVNDLQSATAPINRSTAEVMRFIKPGDKVFNWSALPHVLVAQGAPSAYSMNMCWPYILASLPEATRTQMLKEALRVPPDVVVSMDEQSPPDQGLRNYPMTEARLKQLTGQDYLLVHTTAPIAGRYGSPVSVFRRR
ncbi:MULTISPECIES: hypothetical protein [unclassified Paraburkholderia]|uniref:hypothetical protein n=1 Tax=unclassified Paraburkholderia TaxID=2615204 RepID=UPI000E28623F|nr:MULTISPECIES: hypothetical protein [unclassified Paraburkholderia]